MLKNIVATTFFTKPYIPFQGEIFISANNSNYSPLLNTFAKKWQGNKDN